ncbi:acyl-CoA dehydrogenase [Hydrogenophaga sp. Root209]|uniref:acyl-CoA dehydrogenase n=1 Tax=Hydrogenophaga sp. Root209 TaxID=1736490 RepID=UPI0006FB70D6|nr:acyl-CoA dehydrogenase [Hydrogenophaga sp. Root209]KRC11160.1 acyl-CoA dehydrogenase [Hydrogenophaga sp. Root209]
MNDMESITMFRDSASGYLGAQDQRQRVRALEDAGGGFDRAVWLQLAELGWLSVLVPEADGGLGLGIAEVAAIAEEAGRHLLPEPLVDAGVQPLALLARLPPGDLRDELLNSIQSGATVAGLAWQESAGEVEAGLGMTSARMDGGCVALTGQKRFVRPGPGADGWIVCAVVEDGMGLFWVAAGAAGLSLACDAGVDGSAIATLGLDNAEAQLLAQGDDALAALHHANDLARIAQAAELLGIARRALELTRDYLTTRVQFGKPIGTFQALQHRLVDGLIQVELAAACLRDGLGTVNDGNLASVASRVKARCAQAATETTRMAIQLHGAIGTTNEYDVGLYFKRAMTLASRWGNAASHRRRWMSLTSSANRSEPVLSDVAHLHRREFPNDLVWETMPEAEFRAMVRELFAQHYPEHRRHLPYRQTWAESREWYMTLSRLGWLAPAWPREHGGMGLPADKLIAYIEETEAWGVARPPDQGLVMIGPILMRFGTEEQRQRFLPKVLSGEHVWTQGYSEPNAGSDLAAVRTEAVSEGDHFVVNGQKTWTTWGSDGTHMFMLVRTDKTVKKQAGISFLLVDLKTPGITVRPIRNIAAEHEFCEVFFDNVRVPRDNLVGELNQGWTVAKALLGFERLFTGSPKHSQHTLHQVEKLARQRGLFDDPAFVARFAELQLDTADLGAAYAGFAEIAKRGEPIPPSISMLKIWSTETYERLALLLIESAQDYGSMRDRALTDEIDMHVMAPLFNAMNAKLFAGSNEIQRNILAKVVLDLPS